MSKEQFKHIKPKLQEIADSLLEVGYEFLFSYPDSEGNMWQFKIELVNEHDKAALNQGE